jgi:regulator of replication initiation timing
MEKLFKADKQITEYREMVEAISAKAGEKGAAAGDLKDKKILDLAKKNKALQLQIESLKTKAAKAAEIALKMKKENDEISSTVGGESPQIKKGLGAAPTDTMMASSTVGMSGAEIERKCKELEKKVTKMRNENQELKLQLDRAVKCLERETGEIVSVDDLLREDLGWKGRAQKIEVLKSQVK